MKINQHFHHNKMAQDKSNTSWKCIDTSGNIDKAEYAYGIWRCISRDGQVYESREDTIKYEGGEKYINVYPTSPTPLVGEKVVEIYNSQRTIPSIATETQSLGFW